MELRFRILHFLSILVLLTNATSSRDVPYVSNRNEKQHTGNVHSTHSAHEQYQNEKTWRGPVFPQSTLTFVFVVALNASGDMFSLSTQEGVPKNDVSFVFDETKPNPMVDKLLVDPSSGIVSVVDAEWHGNETEITIKFIAKSSDGSELNIDARVHRVDRGIYSPIFVNEPRPLQCDLPGAIIGEETWIRPETTLLTLQAIDAVDFGAHVTYVLETGGDGRFTVNPVTGEIKTLGRNPFKNGNSFQLAISANIVGIVTGQVTPTQIVTIKSGNVNPQFFLEEYEINMDEFDENSIPTVDIPIAKIKVYSFYDLDVSFTMTPDKDAEGNDMQNPFRIELPVSPKDGRVTTGMLLPLSDVKTINILKGPRQFRFKLTAKESTSGFSSSVQVIVNVMDINDHDPFFLSSFYTRYDVPENTPIGTTLFTVSALDKDEGDNAILDFDIENEDFEIRAVDNYTAEIVVKQELNSNNQPGRRYEFNISATDHGMPPRTGYAKIHIRMLNSDNKSPIFEPANQEAFIREELPEGALVHVVQAYDPDGDISSFTFRLKNNEDLFKIDENTGNITLKKRFVSDKDRRETFFLEVELDDAVNPPVTDNVTVYTMGINRPPVFTNCIGLDAKVQENQPGTTVVIQITASDPDSGISGEMLFRVQGAEEEDRAFDIDDAGDGTATLITKVPFNREDPSLIIGGSSNKPYKFVRIGNTIKYPVTVKVEDKNPKPLYSYCSFLVTILDANNNCPEFDINAAELEDYTPMIPLNPSIGSPLFRAFAFDRDDGENGIVKYSIRNLNCDDCLSIDDGGYIRAQKQLDTVMYQSDLDIMVEVSVMDKPSSDSPPGTGSSSMNITLRRTEEGKLEWEDVEGSDIDEYILHVKENEKGPVGPVFSIKDTDANWFVKDGRYPENNLDHKTFLSAFVDQGNCENNVLCGKMEKASEDSTYPFRYARLMASKGTSQGNSVAIKRVRVRFDAMNLKVPNFAGQNSLNYIPAFVSTETDVGDHVCQIFAYDTDSDPKYNTIKYKFDDSCIEGPCQRFTLDEDTGEIRSNAVFSGDEGGSTFKLSVYARDSPEFSEECSETKSEDCFRKSGSQDISITIAAPTSEKPYFPSDQSSISTDEGFFPPRKNILKVNVTYDGQERLQVKHGIISGNDDHVFAVDANNGQIYQVGELKFGTTPFYTLKVGVFYGELKDVMDVSLTVIERPCLNLHTFRAIDGQPIFVQSSLTEHEDSQTLVEDVGNPGANIKYQLVGPLAYGFKIEGNEVHISEALDRDYPDGYSDWQVNVEAVCKDRNDDDPRSMAIVSLRLKDINDNSPVFDTTTLKGKVLEGTGSRVDVMQVVANDYDEGINSIVMYSIIDGDDFYIGNDNGVVRGGPFDREVQASYTITVQANDKGDQTQGSGPVKQYVWIEIEDIDDHPPRFTGTKKYEASVPENQPPGASVVSVYAEDQDIGDNANRDYTVMEQSDSYFIMDSIRSTGHGVVKINEMIDYEKLGQDKTLSLKVKVSGPKAGDSDEADVTIKITDVNDNAPLVCPRGTLDDALCPEEPPADCSADRTVREDRPLDFLVDEVDGCDSDSGLNAVFDYYIDYENTDTEKKFKIEHDSSNRRYGKVRLRNRLDRETQDQYILHILAVDKGEPQLTGTLTMTVTVSDVNDNAPEFEDPDTWRVVPASTTPNTLVGSWNVIDRDTDENGPPFEVTLDEEGNDVFEENFRLELGSNPIKVYTKKSEYKRTANLKRYTARLKLKDRHQKEAIRELNVEIQDINDHAHSASEKQVTVYSYEGLFTDVWLGHVFAEDIDDWDRTEKTYKIAEETKGFRLEQNSPWNLRMDIGVDPTTHIVQVNVADKHPTARAVVNVDLEFIYEDAINNMGSMRLEGISPEGLVESKLELLKMEIAKAVGAVKENVQILNIRNTEDQIMVTDVYYAVKNSQQNYLRTARLDGRIWNNNDQIEVALDSGRNIKILMSPVNDCGAKKCWGGSCSNQLVLIPAPITVNTNRTSHVGINVSLEAKCQCDLLSFPPEPELCAEDICLNGGTCVETWANVICSCPEGFEGPRCQQMKISFQDYGVAWFQPLAPCDQDIISFQFATKNTGQQVLLFNGPLHDSDSPTHLAIQLDGNGKPWFSVDMGSGSVSKGLATGDSINDGKWHTLQVTKENQEFRMTVDHCKKSSLVDGGQREDRSNCEVTVSVPGDDLVFAPTTPLQLGGIRTKAKLPEGLGQQSLLGCMKNVFHNGKYLDLHIGDVGYGENITAGCPAESSSASTFITTEYTINQTCIGDLNGGDVVCRCLPQKAGIACSEDTVIRDYKDPEAYLEWDMSAPSDNKEDFLQVSFRTRQTNGRIFYAESETTLERMFLEIVDGHLSFTYDLGKGDSILSLSELNVSDGLWHTVYIRRFGIKVILQVDGGEGRYYGELEAKDNLPNLSLSGKKYAGGADVKYRRFHPVPTVTNSIISSQLTDVRFSPNIYPDERLALTVAENSESAGKLKDNAADKIEIGPIPNAPCTLQCPNGKSCVDAWRHYYCSCTVNETENANGQCEDLMGCSVMDCGQTGICVPQADGTGTCYYAPPDMYNAKASLAPAALGIIIACLILMLLLLLLSTIVQSKKKQPESPYLLDPDLENHSRENVMEYCEEGSGEELPVKSELPSLLRLPMTTGFENESELLVRRAAPEAYAYEADSSSRISPDMSPYSPDVVGLIMKNKEEVDEDPACNASDYYLAFEHEGSASLATSLSSLQSSDTGDQNYDYLHDFGPRFQKLADLYGETDDDSETASSAGNGVPVGYRAPSPTGSDEEEVVQPFGFQRDNQWEGYSGNTDTGRLPSDSSQPAEIANHNQDSPPSSGFSDLNPDVPRNVFGFSAPNGYENAAFSDPRYDEHGYNDAGVESDRDTILKPRFNEEQHSHDGFDDHNGLARPQYGSGTFTASAFHEPKRSASGVNNNGYNRYSFGGMQENDVSDV